MQPATTIAACASLASARRFLTDAANRRMLADYAEAAGRTGKTARMAPDVVLVLLEIVERHDRRGKALLTLRRWFDGEPHERRLPDGSREICIPPHGSAEMRQIISEGLA